MSDVIFKKYCVKVHSPSSNIRYHIIAEDFRRLQFFYRFVQVKVGTENDRINKQYHNVQLVAYYINCLCRNVKTRNQESMMTKTQKHDNEINYDNYLNYYFAFSLSYFCGFFFLHYSALFLRFLLRDFLFCYFFLLCFVIVFSWFHIFAFRCACLCKTYTSSIWY